MILTIITTATMIITRLKETVRPREKDRCTVAELPLLLGLSAATCIPK